MSWPRRDRISQQIKLCIVIEGRMRKTHGFPFISVLHHCLVILSFQMAIITQAIITFKFEVEFTR